MVKLVALTGATGFIGSAIIDEFIRQGWSVRALSRSPRRTRPSLEWVTGDLHSLSSLETLVKGCDTIIHCAGTVRGKTEAEFQLINRDGTANIVRACQAESIERRFLLISSLAAREPDLSWYARSKYQGEKELDDIAPHISCTIYRPTAVYGPGDKEIKPLLKSMKNGFLTAPTCESVFTLLHVNDLVAAIFKWADSPIALRATYELDDGSVNGYTWNKLKHICKEVWGREAIVIPIPILLLNMIAHINLLLARVLGYSPMLTPSKIREICHPDWTCSNKAITNELGWQPTISLAQALKNRTLIDI